MKRRLKPITVKRTLERLNYAVSHGFNLGLFLADPHQAEEQGMAYLEGRLDGAPPYRYNNDTKWLNALAQFAGHYGVHFQSRREPPASPRALAPEQVRQLLNFHFRGITVNRFRRALLQFDTIVGARPSELAAMDVRDLDPQQSTIFIRHPAKGGRQRLLPMPRHLWNRNRPFGAYLANRQIADGDSGALWTVGTGRYSSGPVSRVDSDSLRNLMADISVETGVKVTFNVLRHTVGTELMVRTGNLRFVQYWLGHASITSTAVYAEVRFGDLQNEMTRRPAPDYYQLAKVKKQ